MNFYIKTYGCQMNERDSEAVSTMLIKHGYTLVPEESQADIIMVNTCSVRGKAEDKALGKIGLLTAEKKEFPSRIVGIMGCVAQRLKEDVFKKAPGLDFAIGTRSQSRLPEILDVVLNGRGPVLDVHENGKCSDKLSGHKKGAVAAFVNILLGCNRKCAYCVVPRVRGSEWSRPAKEIIEEIKQIVKNKGKEVTLLGQSVMSYGRSNEVWPHDHVSSRGFKEPLPRLLEAVSSIEKLERVRFTSGHPSGCTDELARAMAELPKACEHLHLPVQSGSDRILKMMHRGYTTDDYRSVVNRLRSVMPQIAITTDIITGFPSETVEEFEVTRLFMDEIGFDNAFIFKYSPRPDTLAAEWDDDVAEDEKKRRNQVLLADQDKRGLAINKSLVGRHAEVLVEGESLRNASRWSGRTRTNKIVVFEPTDKVAAGDIVNVKIERAMAQTLYGVIVE
ncbi:tRNA (N6-isopentenyl adenosine(37)-C2)-methylthiotransferase MiaB [Verrucomicrobiota bacterium]